MKENKHSRKDKADDVLKGDAAKGNFRGLSRHVDPDADGYALPKHFRPAFLNELDRRSITYIALSKQLKELENDAGGKQNCSRIKRTMQEKLVFCNWIATGMEMIIADKPKENAALVGKYLSIVKTISTLATALGLERSTKAIIDLKSYIKTKGAK